MRVLTVLAVLLGLVGLTAAQTCAGAGYDVSSAAVDLNIVSGSYTWYLHPCGSISATTSALCANTTLHPYGTSMCQVPTGSTTSSYNIAIYNSSVAATGVTWMAITNGVQYSVQDGDFCSIGAPRENTVQFLCNQTATTPWLKSVTEVETCWYTAVVHTASACTPVSATGSHAVGSTYLDSVCGGEVYDLTALHNFGDLVLDTNTSSPTAGYRYYLNICGNILQANCSGLQPTSFCQLGKPGGAAVASLAVLNSTTLAQYTVNSNGVTMSVQDGTNCGGIPFRQASIQIICDGTTPPTLASVREVETCHYAATVHATCALIAGSSSGTTASATSSSGSSNPGVSSSTASTDTGASTSSGSSSTGASPPPGNGAPSFAPSAVLVFATLASIGLLAF